jgi:serine/threonine protein kinase
LPKAELRRLPFQSPPHSGSKLKIEDFEKIKSMGKGKFGSVFMVRHRQTGFLAALKVIKKRQIV